jgi:hypothetical protein
MNLLKLTHCWNGHQWFLGVAVCLSLLGPAVRPARAQVYEPGSMVLGKPMGDWMNEYLEVEDYEFSSRQLATTSQSGPVIFLDGWIYFSYNGGIRTGSYEIAVPAGAPLWLNLGSWYGWGHGLSNNQSSARSAAKTLTRPLEFKLDDFSLSATELASYWVEVSRPYPFKGFPDVWSAGYALMIEPLSPGEHQLSQTTLNNGITWKIEASINVFELLANTLEADQTYTQSFDALGSDGAANTALPNGWSVTDENAFNIYQQETKSMFPMSSETPGIYPYAMNAGWPGEEDRALSIYVPGNSESQRLDSSVSQIQFLADVNGPVDALQFQFDIEAWDASASTSNRPPNRRGVVQIGEAAFDVMVDLDAGNGFEPFLYFDIVSTGELQKPEGEFINGNEAANRVHFNSGILLESIPAGAQLRFRWAAALDGNSDGLVFGIDNFSVSTLGDPRLSQALAGDAN